MKWFLVLFLLGQAYACEDLVATLNTSRTARLGNLVPALYEQVEYEGSLAEAMYNVSFQHLMAGGRVVKVDLFNLNDTGQYWSVSYWVFPNGSALFGFAHLQEPHEICILMLVSKTI